MESYKETEGEPVVIRRAKALRHLLENHEIVIDDYDLLAGNRTAKPRAGVISPEMSPYWIDDEFDVFPTRPQDTFDISDEDKAYYREVLLPFWSGQSLNGWYQAHIDDEVAEAERQAAVTEMLAACKQWGTHTAIESTLALPLDDPEALAAACDVFLIDFKIADRERSLEVVVHGE